MKLIFYITAKRLKILNYIKSFIAQSDIYRRDYDKNFVDISRYVDVEEGKDTYSRNSNSSSYTGSGNNITSGDPGLLKRQTYENRVNILLNKEVLTHKETLINTMRSYLQPLSKEGINVRSGNEEDDQKPEAKQWFKIVTTQIVKRLTDSNFGDRLLPSLSNCFDYGMGCLMSLNEGDKMHFTFIPHYCVNLLEDTMGRVSKVSVNKSYTGTQLAEYCDSIGVTAPSSIEELSNYEVSFFFIKKDKFNKKYFKTKKAFASGIYVKDLEGFVAEDSAGYNEMPIFPFRYSKWDNPYGVGPGSRAATVCKQINQIIMDLFEATQKSLKPALIFYDDQILDQLEGGDIPASAILAGDSSSRGPGIERIHDGAPYIAHTWQTLNEHRQMLRDVYHNRQITNDKNAEQSATEISDIRSQRSRALGPATLNIVNDLIFPVCRRIYSVLKSEGKLPPVPEILKKYKNKFVIELTSQLHDSSAQQELTDFQQLLQLFTPLIEIEPKVRHLLDCEKSVRRLFKIMDFDGELRSAEEFKTVIQEYEKEQSRKKQMEDDKHNAELVESGSRVAQNANY